MTILPTTVEMESMDDRNQATRLKDLLLVHCFGGHRSSLAISSLPASISEEPTAHHSETFNPKLRP